jgi:hypothetical protein
MAIEMPSDVWQEQRRQQQQEYAAAQARRDQVYGAAAERSFADRQQQTAIQGQRQLKADQFGYDTAMQGQQGQIQGQQQDARFMHEDELFERHAAATDALSRLDQIHAERTAAINHENQTRRDYLLQQFHEKDVVHGEEFTAGQEEKRFGEAKELGSINHENSLESKWIDHQNALEAGEHAAMVHAQLEPFLTQEAANLHKLNAQVDYGLSHDLFNDENKAKAKAIKDGMIDNGIQDGSGFIDDPTGLIPKLRLQLSDLGNVFRTKQISQDDYIRGRDYLNDQIADARRDAYRERTPEEKAALQKQQLAAFVQEHHIPAKDAPYIVFNKAGQPRFMEGYKPGNGGPVTKEEELEFRNANPGLPTELQVGRDKNGNVGATPDSIKLYIANKTGEQKQSQFEAKQKQAETKEADKQKNFTTAQENILKIQAQRMDVERSKISAQDQHGQMEFNRKQNANRQNIVQGYLTKHQKPIEADYMIPGHYERDAIAWTEGLKDARQDAMDRFGDWAPPQGQAAMPSGQQQPGGQNDSSLPHPKTIEEAGQLHGTWFVTPTGRKKWAP